MNFTRGNLSFLITVFSMSLVVLGLYNIHLGQKEEDEYVIEMTLLDDEELEKLIEQEKAMEEIADPIKSHMAFNETAKPSYGDPEPLKTLEELIEEQQASDNTGEFNTVDSSYADSLKELAKKREEKKQLLGEREAQKEERTQNLAKRRTSVSFSLVDRNNYKLPPPIYTCIEGGKVVINIKVDSSGNVIETSFNEKSSNTSNGCLVDNATEYALKATFSTSSKTLQKGTITYVFQGK